MRDRDRHVNDLDSLEVRLHAQGRFDLCFIYPAGRTDDRTDGERPLDLVRERGGSDFGW